MKKKIHVLSIAFLITSCATAPKPSIYIPACSNSIQPRLTFTVALNVRPHKALHVSETETYVKSLKEDQVFEVNYLYRTILDGKDAKYTYASKFKEYRGIQTKSVVQVSKNNFVICDYLSCIGLVEPISGQKVLHEIDERPAITCLRNDYSFGSEFPVARFFSGINDPGDRQGHYNCYGSRFDVAKFLELSGIGSNGLFSNKTFAIPQRKQASLCQSVGLNQDCFILPANNSEAKNKLKDYDTLNFSKARLAFETIYFKCRDVYPEFEVECYQKYKNNPENTKFTKAWEDKLAYDILAKRAAKFTSETRGEWSITKMDVDLNEMCSYAQDNSVMFTQ